MVVKNFEKIKAVKIQIFQFIYFFNILGFDNLTL